MDQSKYNKLMCVVIGLSISSVIAQFFTYKFLWPSPGDGGGPMGMMANEIQCAMALAAVAGISFVIFILMLILGVKWYVGQGLAIVNFFVAIMASVA